MERLRIEGSDDSPEVLLDKTSGEFVISGKSLPEDVVDFFEPVLEWLEAYADDPLEKTVFNFKLIYFNTASSKLILDILMVLEDMKSIGHEVLVKWHSQQTDEDMQEAGEEYAELVDVEFEHLTYS